MTKAYRKPVSDTDVDRFMGVITAALNSGKSFADAMIAGYSAVLCSPTFVCLEEKPGLLDHHAVANRLSYFLWNTAPDNQLRRTGGRAKIARPFGAPRGNKTTLGRARSDAPIRNRIPSCLVFKERPPCLEESQPCRTHLNLFARVSHSCWLWHSLPARCPALPQWPSPRSKAARMPRRSRIAGIANLTLTDAAVCAEAAHVQIHPAGRFEAACLVAENRWPGQALHRVLLRRWLE